MDDNHSPIRILVVDDHLVVRQGFAMLLMAFSDMQLVGTANNGEEAVKLCDTLELDVVLMDMMMPGIGGVEAIRAIHRNHPAMQIIAITSFSDDSQLVQAATEAGAIGYIFKDVSMDELAYTIRSVYQNRPALSPSAIRLLIQAKTQRPAEDFALSERESAVMALMAEGLANLDISERLSISVATVKFHVSSILRKLGASSRTEAVVLARQHRLIK